MTPAENGAVAKSEYEFRVAVLTSLSTIEANLENACGQIQGHDKKLTEHDRAIVELKVKAGVWGALSGAIAAAAIFLGVKN